MRRLSADAGRDRLLPDRDMQRPGDFARLVRLERGLLEGADARHGPIEAGQAAEIVARIAHEVRPGEARLAREGCGMFEHAAKRPLGETSQSRKPLMWLARLTRQECLHSILDSVTVFPPDARGRAAIAASHGGVYAAYLAAKAGIKAVILCDAGVGRERAGIGGLDYLDRLGVAAAAIGHRIGAHRRRRGLPRARPHHVRQCAAPRMAGVRRA